MASEAKMQEHYKLALERYQKGEGDSDEYDSDEEREIIKHLSKEEKIQYLEYREVFINQLVHYGRFMAVDEEIRRHMFHWLPGCPEEYAQKASEAVQKLRTEKAAVEERRRSRRKQKVNLIKQRVPDDPDLIVLKFTPGIGPIIPVVKQEPVDPEETTHPSTSVTQPTAELAPTTVAPTETVTSTSEIDELMYQTTLQLQEEDNEGDDTTIDDMVPQAADRPKLLKALKQLGDAAHQMALGYEDLQAAVPKLEDQEVAEIVTTLPTPVSAHIPLAVKDFIEREEPLTVTHVVAIGSFYLESYLHSKYPATKKPTKRAVAKRFGITERKFIELTQGIAYSGGSSTPPKLSPKSATATGKRKSTTPSKKVSKKLRLQLERLPEEKEDEPAPSQAT